MGCGGRPDRRRLHVYNIYIIYIYITGLRRLDEKGWVAAVDQTGDAYIYVGNQQVA